uniref:Uncharacterized protein n=1 Tax=Panagrolaimus superbus TaxID=310955 RepID=A0A914XQZ7_9BILA
MNFKIAQFATLGGYLFLATATAENNDQNQQPQDANHGIVPKESIKPPIEKSKSPRLLTKLKHFVKKLDK